MKQENTNLKMEYKPRIRINVQLKKNKNMFLLQLKEIKSIYFKISI